MNYLEKFYAKVKGTDRNGCHIWGGSVQYSGKNRQAAYPSIKSNFDGKSKTWRGNRYIWTLLKGSIPQGMNVCHSCDNTMCVNIEHLFLGTHTDNMQDKISKNRDHNKKKTHCLKGHPFEGENLIVRKDGARSCRTCMRAYWTKFDEKNREKRRVAALKRYYETKEKEVKSGKHSEN